MSVPQIKELISINEKILPDTGVDPDWYNDEELNLHLCRGYIFSPDIKYYENRVSSLKLLKIFKDDLTAGNKRNNYIITSGYSTGKTHFSILLANYFSKSHETPEIQSIYEALAKSCNPEISEDFKEFKKTSRVPQLVIRLSGDKFFNLRSGFFKAIKNALSENPETRDYELPFIFSNALLWLQEHLDDNQKKKADAFLLFNYEINLAELVKKLENFEHEAVNISVEVCKHLFHITPDFGSEVNLENVILQVFNNLCSKEDSPYDKMVIIFDELGLYIDKYRSDNTKAGGSALQEIVNACDKLSGKISFISFIHKDQLDYFKKDDKDYIDRFFTLINRENRFHLASPMEMVVKSAIKRLPLWPKFMMNIFQFGIISNQSHSTLPYYKHEGMDEKTFLDSITMSCYPLHPVTTALICRLNLARGRSVGGFVKDKLLDKMEEPAIVNLDCGIYGGQITDFPNWIYPYEITDYFEENLRKVEENTYNKLLYSFNITGEGAPGEALKLLKALFLYHLAGLDKGEDHSKLLSLLSGLEYSTCKYYLKELSDKYKVIYFHETRKEYDFYIPGRGVLDVYKKLDDEVSTQPLNFERLADYLMKYEFKKFQYFARELGLDGKNFISKRKLCRNEYSMNPVFLSSSGITDDIEDEYEKLDKNKFRGLICYSITEFEDEILEDRRNAGEILLRLRSAYENYPLPVLFAFPRKPVEGIFVILLKLSVLNSWPSQIIKEYGQGYQKARAELGDLLKEKIQVYFKNLDFITHEEVINDLKEEEHNSQQAIINKLFEISFPFRPPLNCSDLTDSSRAKKYVGICAGYLCNYGRCDEERDLKKIHKNTKSVISRIIQEVLLPGKDKWGIIDENRNAVIPDNKLVKKAWELLDREVENDETLNLFEIYKILQEPPFGYDDLSFTLLLSSWMGFYRQFLEIYSGKTKIEIEKFSEYFSQFSIISRISKEKIIIKKLDEFLIEILHVKKSLKGEINSYNEAVSLLNKVKTIITDKKCSEKESKELKLMLLPIKEDIEKHDTFFKNMMILEKQLKESASLIKLCEIRRKIKDLVFPEKIKISSDKYEKLLRECDENVEMEVKNPPVLKKIEDYSYLRNYLEEIKYFLLSANLNNLTKEVDAHFFVLDEDYRKLQAEDQQKRILQTIKKMPSPVDLPFKDIVKNFDTVNSYLEKIDIWELKSEAEKKQKEYLERLDFLRNQISEIEEKVYKVGSISECDFLRDKLNSLKSFYKDSEYETIFPGLLHMIEEKRENLCDLGKIAREKKAILQEFFYLKSLAEECNDPIMLYNLYGQINNVEISSKQMDKYELKQIEDAKKFILDRFTEYTLKELTDREITKKSDYKKKKSKFLIFEERIKPVGEIDNNFLLTVKEATERLEEEYRKWEGKQKLIKKKEKILEKFYNLKKSAEKSRDTLSLYEFYIQINKIKILPDLMDKEELAEIEESKNYIFKKFSDNIKLELDVTAVSNKSGYHKKKILFKDFKKKIKPTGNIDKNFINNIKIAEKKLKEEYSIWKDKQEKEKTKKKAQEKIKEIEVLSADKISTCNRALEDLSELKKFSSRFDLTRLFEGPISRQTAKIEAIKEDFINRLGIYKSIIQQTVEPVELIKIKEELLRIQYIFDDFESEREFQSVIQVLDNKLSLVANKVKQIRRLFYSINEKHEKLDCFIKLFQGLSSEEQRNILTLISKR